MKPLTFFPAVLLLLVTASGLSAQRPDTDRLEASEGPVTIQPVRHGTLVLSWNGITIYADPAGGAGAFQGIESPDLVLITDIHGDHLSLETLNGLNMGSSVLVVPRA
ncbi:MAG: MBL fold metallo-hydrolase, partial [Balneolaceae bacterium]|nr:MBL fold metallo-hydrolase [Balneolaceae bacterium]